MRTIEHHALYQKGTARDLFYSVRPGAEDILLVLHGAGGSARGYLKGNDWLAADGRFAILAPQGLPYHPWRAIDFDHNPQVWNSGHINEHHRTQFDDVAFLVEAIGWFRRRFHLTGKIYIAGHSMGGTMGFRLIEAHPGLIDTMFAVGSGWLRNYRLPDVATCPNLVYVCGGKDPLNPFQGGFVRMPWIEFGLQSVMSRMEAWAQHHGHGERVLTGDSPELTEWAWQGDRLLRLIRVNGHGHAWPKGSVSGVKIDLLGPSVTHFDATSYARQLFDTLARPRE